MTPKDKEGEASWEAPGGAAMQRRLQFLRQRGLPVEDVIPPPGTEGPPAEKPSAAKRAKTKRATGKSKKKSVKSKSAKKTTRKRTS